MRLHRTGSLGAVTLATLLAGTLASPAVAAGAVPQLVVGDPSVSTDVSPTKVDVMGLWAHPDDDAGFTTPCGVWHDLYGVTCGIIMETRGEGGSNSVGPEAGPDLGLRRENEDRTSHVRSGTIDIYNVDRVDFWYNTSAPLTAEVWDKEEGLRQTVRILRETQPDILMASSPQASGHGNHQYAQGRMVWEAAAAAADPTMYPEQLTGPDAVQPWRVKKIVGIGSTAGSGGQSAPECNTGFVPSGPYTVVGTWTGHESPYVWAEGNTAGIEAGTPKTWGQVGREGGRAHPTQARVMQKDPFASTCQRYAIAESFVPIQPNSSAENGRDDAVLFGAVVADPGGMPLGSTFHLEVGEFFAAPGTPFEVSVHMRSGADSVAGGALSLDLPAGWTSSAAQGTGTITSAATTTRTFTVTPPADAAVGVVKLAAKFDNGEVTAYNDTRVQVVQPVEGRYVRWGNQAEYEEWAAQYTWLGGRGSAIIPIGAGETVSVPVEVSNRSTETQSGSVSLTAPAGFTLDTATQDFGGLAAGETTTLTFHLTHTDVTALASTATLPITTSFGDKSSTENATVSVVPTTVIPQAAEAPELDGELDASYGPALSLANRWEGSNCASAADCGGASEARLAWHDDALYVHVTVVDDIVSAAATPERCFGHWLVDSVEVLLDPLGGSVDPSTTFKSGIFPFTDDPENVNGNGVDGPCWSRDADNHQGFSTGPLADQVQDGPNAPGQEVVVNVVRNGDNTYEGGKWVVETKISLADLPAAVGPTSAAPTGDADTNVVDPTYLGLNVTPYDSDRQDFIGETRTAWSAHGGQQSEPYRWGHAYLEGYEPPAGRSAEPTPAIIPQTALKSVESPQSVAQSASRGVTLSGLQPSRALTIGDVTISDDEITIPVTATEAGTVRAFLWNGDQRFIPVWTTSCEGDEWGFDACDPSDGQAPPWGDDMSGRLLGKVEAAVGTGASTVTVPVNGEVLEKLAVDGAILVSWQSASEGVAAWNFPVLEGPLFTDVPRDHQFATEIGWLLERGIAEGYADGSFGTTTPVSRQAMAAFMYRYAGASFVPAAGTRTFSDVGPSHPFYKEIEWMAAEGLSEGYSDGTYGATRPVSRQAMAAFLYRLAGEPTVSGSPTFSDVPAGSQFARAIRWMEVTELSTGYADGTYRGGDAVSRQAMAAFLYRYDQDQVD